MADQTFTIPKNWKMTTLGEVAEITSSKRIFAEEYLTSGVPFYRGKEIIEKFNGNEISTDLFISENKFDEIKKKFGAPKAGEMLLTSVGTLGIPYIVKNGEKFYFKDGNLTWFRNFDGIDNFFIYYWIISDLGKEQLASHTIGSTQQALTIVGLKSVSIFLPPLPEQRAIAAVLSSLDDKIELLREQNKTLESAAQAIFKEWFVDFNFPGATGKMIDSLSACGHAQAGELGKIPEGWKVGRIDDLIDILSGFAFSSSDFSQDGQYKLVTIKNVQDRYFDSETKDKLSALPAKMPDYCKLDTGDILLSLTGNVGRICLVNGEDYLLNQRVAKLRAKNPIDYAFSYLLFLQDSIFSLLQSTASGTANQNLSPIQTKEIEIIIADRKTLDQFGMVANKLIQKVKDNNSQIQIISVLRDALLPKLMKGAVRVLVGAIHELPLQSTHHELPVQFMRRI